MICDALATLADDVALNTGVAGNYTIGDQIDLQVARNIGVALGFAQLYLVVTVDTTATSGGLATGQFSLITDDNASMTSPTVLASSAAIPVAQLTAGTAVFVTALPMTAGAYERYLGLQQTTGTAAFTGGAINAFFTTSPPAYSAYPQGDGAAL